MAKTINKTIITVLTFISFSVSYSITSQFVIYIDKNINVKVNNKPVSPADLDDFKQLPCIGKEISREQLDKLIKGNKNVSRLCVSKIKNFSWLFANSSFNQDISNWDVSSGIYFSGMFFKNHSFNQPLNKWNTSNAINMSDMFFESSSFNQPVYHWDTSKVVSFESMFHAATSFNQPLNDWNTSNVTNMYSMLSVAKKFNQPLNKWDTSKVVVMDYLLVKSAAFNQNISKWDVHNVKSTFAFSNKDFISSFKQESPIPLNYLPNFKLKF